MDTRQLAAFCAVIEKKSFSQAAERLGVTQPAVSLQIRALEKRLGASKSDASGPPNLVVASSNDLRKRIAAIEEELIQVNGKSSEDSANYPTKLESKFGYLQNVTDSADTAPTGAELAVFAELDQRLETQLAKWREVLVKDVPALNEAMRKNNVPLVAPTATPAK